ncbi:MAG: PAS domain S-box protein, partial [Sulfurimonas sp.]
MLKQYKEAIEKSNIISKTDVNGIITFVNDEFCNISGYTKSELIGQNHNIVRH